MITPLIKVRNLLSKNPSAGGFDAILISSVSNIIYFTNYSGFSKDEREAYLFITKNQQYILTDGRYTAAVKTLIPDFKLIEISSKFSFEKALKNLTKKHKIKKVGFEGKNISFLEHKKLLKCFDDSNHRDLDSLRSVKTSDEILKIEKACELGDKTFKYILKEIKLGVSEKELAVKIELFIKQNLADISFPPIVAFGANSAIPHHQVTNSKLANNQIVLLDFGVKLDNYCSDMTRTVFFGSAKAEFRRIYEIVLTSQQKAIQQFNNLTKRQLEKGIKASEIDKIARNYIISKGYSTIPHSLGHGIGLEVHEGPHLSPKSKDILKEGMVFSIEPGIYLPAEALALPEPLAKRRSAKEGIPNFGGVRIEDLAVLEKNNLRLLTHSPKNLIEL